MARRFRAAGLTAAALCLALAACTGTSPTSPEAAAVDTSSAETPEEQLSLQSRALQRTVLEGALAGAALGAATNRAYARPVPLGLVVGFSTGAAAGSYVAYLQSRYASNETRLERLRSDIDATNAETEAAIRTMRVVLDRQRSDLAAIRASTAGRSTPELDARIATAASSLEDMELAIAGASRREAEFEQVRGLQLADDQVTGVDSQIAELGTRISEMRQIADTLAQEI